MYDVLLCLFHSVIDILWYTLLIYKGVIMSLHEIIQETLDLPDKERYILIENLVNSFHKEIEIVQASKNHLGAFGILQGADIDPVKWQEELRRENDSDIYK